MTRARDVASSGGLVLLNTTAYSAVTQVDITNLFNSTYLNYLVMIDCTDNSAAAGITYQLLSGSTPLTTNYVYALNGLNGYGTVTNSFTGTSSTTSIDGGSTSTQYTGGLFSRLELYKPFLSARTNFAIQYLSPSTLPENSTSRVGGGHVLNTNSYDGLRMSIGSGTITGTTKVYGYK